jgi:hypothetical protein
MDYLPPRQIQQPLAVIPSPVGVAAAPTVACAGLPLAFLGPLRRQKDQVQRSVVWCGRERTLRRARNPYFVFAARKESRRRKLPPGARCYCQLPRRNRAKSFGRSSRPPHRALYYCPLTDSVTGVQTKSMGTAGILLEHRADKGPIITIEPTREQYQGPFVFRV